MVDKQGCIMQCDIVMLHGVTYTSEGMVWYGIVEFNVPFDTV